MMNVKCLVVGMIAENCYVVADNDTKECVIIDPGDDAPAVSAYIHQAKLTPVAVLNTHGHSDHIGANDALRDEFKIPLYIHEADANMLGDARLNLSLYIGTPITSRAPEHLIHEGDVIEFGHSKLAVIETPGHSPGGVSFVGDGVVFSGDALFAGSIGRTDFPGSNTRQLLEAIADKLLTLPDNTLVWSGHGPVTSIAREKMCNPYVGE